VVSKVAVTAFNRTRMELKLRDEWKLSKKLLSFNRTRMELKFAFDSLSKTRFNAFNRTRMELKYYLPVAIGEPVRLLIEPEWN
jgi:hypothetical protein